MCTKNHNHMRYGSWDRGSDRQNFLSFWTNNPENQNLEKMKKIPKILSFYTSAPKIMIICYTVPKIWYMADCYFSSWVTFYHFTPLTARKIKIKKKRNKVLEIPSFYTSVPKIMITYSAVPEIWHMTNVIIFHFELIVALFTPNSSKNQKFKKNEKNWDMLCHRQTNGWTGKWNFSLT